MRISLKPKTTMGKWSVRLIVASFLLFVAFNLLLVTTGQRAGETFSFFSVFTVPILLAWTSGVAAFVTGLIGVLRSKDWAILVDFAIALGLYVLVFGLGEILFPH